MIARTLLLTAGGCCVLASILCAAPDAAPAKVPAKLARARLDAAHKTYDLVWKNYREGLVPSVETVYRWSRRWLKAEREASEQKAQHVAAVQAHWERMRELEKWARDLFRVRITTITEVSAAEYYTAEAEIWLTEAKNP